MILSGIFGFIYETFFYKIDLGYFVKRGSTYGPWIPIYVWGGLLIIILTYRFKGKPILVFLLNCLITGTLEYTTGYALLKYKNIRLWDYNTEIWNFGNINGFVCLRSILFFGLASLFLIYILVPIVVRLTKKIPEYNLIILSSFLGFIFIIDVFLYSILH